MTLERIKELWEEDELESILHAGGEVIEEGDWTQDHKYQHCETIIKFEDKYYEVQESRSGSYHTDWYYDDVRVIEVIREEKVVTKTEVTYKGTGKEITIPSRW